MYLCTVDEAESLDRKKAIHVFEETKLTEAQPTAPLVISNDIA